MIINEGFLLIMLLFCHFTLITPKPSFIEIETKSPYNYNTNIIEGGFNFNGNAYTALCECHPLSNRKADKITAPSCDPSKLRIISELEGEGASYNQIRKLIGTIEDLSYISIEEASFKCLDGRYSTAILGTPGGDAGEFLMALSVYEDLVLDKTLSQESVDNFFYAYLGSMKQDKFYMCTDDNAINHLELDLSVILIKLNT